MLFNLNCTATFPFALSLTRTHISLNSLKSDRFSSLILYERVRGYLTHEFYKYTAKSGKEALIFIEGKSASTDQEINTELFAYTSTPVLAFSHE